MPLSAVVVKCRWKEGAGGDGLGKVWNQKPIRARSLQMRAWRRRCHLERELERALVLRDIGEGVLVGKVGDGDEGFWVGLDIG